MGRSPRFAELDALIAKEPLCTVTLAAKEHNEPRLPASTRRPPAAEAIICDVVRELGITREELFSDRRFPILVEARSRIIIRLHELKYSSTRIGRVLGGMHHTAVLYHLGRSISGEVRPKNGKRKAPEIYDLTAPDESGIWAI